jgi:AraC family transcriptional regulator
MGGSLGASAGRLISAAVGFAPNLSSVHAGWRSACLYAWRGDADECAFPQLDEPVVVYHTGGAARVPVRYRGRTDAASHPGLFTFLPPDTPITWQIGGEVHSYSVHLKPDCFSDLLDEDGARLVERMRFKCGFSDPLLGGTIHALAAEAARPRELGPLVAESLADTLALCLARSAGAADRGASMRGGLAPHVLRRVLELIETGIEGGVSLQALARQAGLSRTHFATAFRQSTGMPPHRYLTGRRIAVARDKLATSGEPIAQVAFDCGFSSQAHFTESFRRATGITPAAFRQMRRATQNRRAISSDNFAKQA